MNFISLVGFTGAKVAISPAAGRTALAWYTWQSRQPAAQILVPQGQPFNPEVMLNATQVREDLARLVGDAIKANGYSRYAVSYCLQSNWLNCLLHVK